MRRKPAALLVLSLLAMSAAAVVSGPTGGTAEASALSTSTYFSAGVQFQDGSELVTRSDTGQETLVPATDGTPGDAGAAAADNSVQVFDPNGVSAMTSTPDGFHLYGNNVTAYGYIYNSDVLATFLE